MADDPRARGGLDPLGTPKIGDGTQASLVLVEPRSARALTLVRVRPDETEAIAAIERALGSLLPRTPNTSTALPGGTLHWLGPDEWLVDVAASHAEPLRALREVPARCFALVIDLSAGRTCLRLAGARVTDVLRKGCPLDLHPATFGKGACARSLLGRVGVLIHCVEPEYEYHVVVDRSYADYLWKWLEDAAHEYLAPARRPQ